MDTERTINWRTIARSMLDMEMKMRPLHQPPSTGCFVRWRGINKVGMVQWPIDSAHIAVVFLSITSKHDHPEFVRALKNLDPDRLQLQADAELDLTGNFHVLHRVGVRLTSMTEEETEAMSRYTNGIVSLTPTEGGIHFDGVIGPGALHLYRNKK